MDSDVEIVAGCDEGAVRLAELVSVAVRVEPEYLRAVRLELAHDLRAGVEASLWFSPLIESRSSRGFVLRPGVAAVLQERLTRGSLAGRAWTLRTRFHAFLSPAVAFEEEVRWLAMTEPDAKDKIEQALRRALKAMTSSGPDRGLAMARWAVRALPTLPEAARRSEAATLLAIGTAARVPSEAFKERVTLGTLPKGARHLLLKTTREVEIGVRLFEGTLEFTAPGEAGSVSIRLPDTRPLYLTMRGESGPDVVVNPSAGERVEVPSATRRLTLTTLARRAYELAVVETEVKAAVELKLGDFIRLGKALAGLFLSVEEARTVAELAGLSLSRIDFRGSAEVVWLNVVNEARKSQTLRELVEIVAERYPDQPVLSALMSELWGAPAIVPSEASASSRSPETARATEDGTFDFSRMRYDFFLAHASPDGAAAEQLYDALVTVGLRVFLASRSIGPGEQWSRVIPRAQRDSRATLVLVMGRFDEALYLRDEVATAIARHRESPDGHAVIPVFVEGMPVDAFAIPYGLRVFNGLDAPKSGGIVGVATRLREQVERWRGVAVPTPVPSPATRDPRCEPVALHSKLCRLLDTQFETVILYAGLDRSVIAASTAPQSRRALDVVGLVMQGTPEVCTRVCAAISRVAPQLA